MKKTPMHAAEPTATPIFDAIAQQVGLDAEFLGQSRDGAGAPDALGNSGEPEPADSDSPTTESPATTGR
jgi:hypothetical protein